MSRPVSARSVMAGGLSWYARAFFVFCCLLLGVGAISCDDKQFGEEERREVNTVLSTGIGFSSDPYVQAETLRVLEIVGDPSLNHYAEELVETSDSAMVRVAALRVLLANDYKDIRRVVLRVFAKAEAAERTVILQGVSELGSTRLRRVLMGRAINSGESQLRLDAFRRGPLERLERAKAQNKTAYLQNTLFPEIGQFVQDSDPILAAAALHALVDAGQSDRAEPLLKMLNNRSAPRDKRLRAAEILARARMSGAADGFEKILRSVRVNSKGKWVVPERIDRELVRTATLGLVATGNTDLVLQAQSYLDGADVAETIEVLEALDANASEDAAISLKVAMQDARPQVRDAAIGLYAGHEFAEASAFTEIMSRSDFDTRRRLAQALAQHYPAEWARELTSKLGNKRRRVEALELLRDAVESEAQTEVLNYLEEPLAKLASGGQKKENALAALLLLRVKDDPKTRQIVAAVENPATHYAYLEYLVRTAPRENVEYFRKNLHYDDLYAIRLMSAAGMLRAFEAGATQDPDSGEKSGALPALPSVHE